MKALRVGVCLLIAFTGVLGFASEPAAAVDPLSSVAGLLAQEHQHSRPSTPPLSLAELKQHLWPTILKSGWLCVVSQSPRHECAAPGR